MLSYYFSSAEKSSETKRIEILIFFERIQSWGVYDF